jgi:hypothetical protein
MFGEKSPSQNIHLTGNRCPLFSHYSGPVSDISRYYTKEGSQMKVMFGKHLGESVELLMLKEPDYIKWILDQKSPTGAMVNVKTYIQKLIKIFDDKPFVGKQCWSKICQNPATKFTVYLDNLAPYWWCDTCDPYQTGANSGKLQSPIDYQSALQHVELFCRNRKSDYKEVIKMMSQAKGLPARVGEAQAQKFFHG